MITAEEISLTFSLFKWINPSANPSPVLWNIGDEICEYRVYQYQKNKKTIAVWMDAPKLSEPEFIRIYKKINIIPHEFFLTQNNGKYRFGWRVKK